MISDNDDYGDEDDDDDDKNNSINDVCLVVFIAAYPIKYFFTWFTHK